MGVAREAVLRLRLRLRLRLQAFNFWGLPGNSEISKSALSQARTRVGWQRGVPATAICRAARRRNPCDVCHRTGAHADGETSLFEQLIDRLKPDMVCLADRFLLGYKLRCKARQTGARLLWRVKKNSVFPVSQALPDGSCVSQLRRDRASRLAGCQPKKVRIIEYHLDGDPQAETLYRLVSRVLDPQLASAQELAVLFHERWEIEGTLGEMKTYLRGARVVLRSKTTDLVRQAFYALWLVHFAIRRLMH